MRKKFRGVLAGHQASMGVSSLMAATAVMSSVPSLALGQDTVNDQQELGIEEVVVQGSRETIRNSIETKRLSDNVVEALSFDEIGELPALSIGEALENLTSAASHREQGGATEISIRGMGPYLSSTVMNGREATNGSGDRSVNFSQFPSELFNKLEIYKTQEASLIEGGVSGQIALSTLRPLDYGKRRAQVEVKAGYNPDNANIDDNAGDIKYRTTLSYVDSFETESAGSFGFSLGYQSNEATNPEGEYRSTSAFGTCLNDPSLENTGVYRTSNGNCNGSSSQIQSEAFDGSPYVFTSSSRRFRQNTTDDERDSLFAAFQWQPNDKLDINVDYQTSDRTFTEERNDLVFSEMRRIAAGQDDAYYNTLGVVDGVDNFQTNGAAITQFRHFGRVETNSEYMERIEEYSGGGIGFEYQVTENLSVSFDASFSETKRQENIWQVRLQSEATNIGDVARINADGSDSTDRPFTIHDFSYSRADVDLVTIENFDVTNHDVFADSARTRIDLNQFREHENEAYRFDLEYLTEDLPFISSVEAGVRQSEMQFRSFPRSRVQMNHSDEALDLANVACRTDFAEADFLSALRNGNDLITNVDSTGAVIASGTGNSYATFDARCLVNELYGYDVPDEAVPGTPEPSLANPSNVDVTEETTAAYIQFNYDSEIGGLPVRGNFGARLVSTDVESIGFRTDFMLVDELPEDPTNAVSLEEIEDSLATVKGGNSYTEVLPSFNLAMDLSDELVFRGGVYRGMSRPDPDALGFGRTLNVNADGDETSLADFTTGARALNNPKLKPLMSWNYDLALEYYANEDTLLAIGYYSKNFQGGFDVVQQQEAFVIDGVTIPITVATQQTSADESTISGFELTATHTFSYLPFPFNGLGAKLSYNQADSDFEFEDDRMGTTNVALSSGEVVEQVGIIPPTELFGFSERVSSAQVFYQVGEFDISLINKRRSEYFQQFISNPGTIRLVEGTDVWELRASYKLTDNVTVKFEGINIFDEPKTQFNPTSDHLSEVNTYGPRYYIGVRAKF